MVDPEVAENTLASVDNPTGAIELDELRCAIGMLSAEQREAVLMVGAAGLTYDEVSSIANVAVGTVKSRVSRGRARLAEILEGSLLPDDGQPAHAAAAWFLTQLDDHATPQQPDGSVAQPQ